MCGLFGFIGKKQTKLNHFLLLQLGIDNDVRGGDSCGIFVDGNVEYGVNDKKLFSNFYRTSKLMRTNEAQVFLGHTRKASVGTVSLQTAQPVCIYNDNGEIEFVLTHNGTIRNYKELAVKYLTDYDESMTDSQVMAWIFYYHGYDVLDEYIGGGMFITADYRNKDKKPVIHMFKGASRNTKHSGAISEERPLYYINTPSGIFYSSREDIFELLLFNTKYSPIDMVTNTLYMVEDGIMYQVCKYERNECYQANVSGHVPAAYGYGQYYDYYEEMYGGYYGYNQPKDKDEYISLAGCKYYHGATPCEGKYALARDGKVLPDNPLNETFWFFNGYLVNGEQTYIYLTNLCESYSCQRDDVINILEKDFSKLCLLPVWNNNCCKYTDRHGYPIGSYKFIPPFQKTSGKKLYVITEGSLSTSFVSDYKDGKPNCDLTDDSMLDILGKRSSEFDFYDENDFDNLIYEL